MAFSEEEGEEVFEISWKVCFLKDIDDFKGVNEFLRGEIDEFFSDL